MSAPCTRPECGGVVHTDIWGDPIQCPRACPASVFAHDAHDGCPGWMPDDGTGPEAPPQATPLEEAQATVKSLRYQIRRAREALADDGGNDAEAAVARVRQLHREEYGCCAACTSVHAVLYPCPTIRVIDGQEASGQPDHSARIAELEGQIERVRKVVAERRIEVAEREADGTLPFGTPGAAWCDAVTVTCARIDDALRVFPPAAAVPEPAEVQEAP